MKTFSISYDDISMDVAKDVDSKLFTQVEHVFKECMNVAEHQKNAEKYCKTCNVLLECFTKLSNIIAE